MSPQSVVHSPQSTDPANVLSEVAAELRDEGTVISEHVVEPGAQPVLGLLVAAGPRCREAPGEYARVLESVREGYLLHYGTPRVLAGVDRDLALLAGDHLYALGLERLSRLGDLEAIRELADLISLCAQLHAVGAADGSVATALWLAAAVAVAAGGSEEHRSAKTAASEGAPAAGEALGSAARSRAAAAGLAESLRRSAEAIESAGHQPSGGA